MQPNYHCLDSSSIIYSSNSLSKPSVLKQTHYLNNLKVEITWLNILEAISKEKASMGQTYH